MKNEIQNIAGIEYFISVNCDNEEYQMAKWRSCEIKSENERSIPSVQQLYCDSANGNHVMM